MNNNENPEGENNVPMEIIEIEVRDEPEQQPTVTPTVIQQQGQEATVEPTTVQGDVANKQGKQKASKKLPKASEGVSETEYSFSSSEVRDSKYIGDKGVNKLNYRTKQLLAKYRCHQMNRRTRLVIQENRSVSVSENARDKSSESHQTLMMTRVD